MAQSTANSEEQKGLSSRNGPIVYMIKRKVRSSVVGHICNPSTRETEASLKLVRVQNKTLPQKDQEKN
jgi:hypothetical protein